MTTPRPAAGPSHSTRLPSLEGLRALACLAVVLQHWIQAFPVSRAVVLLTGGQWAVELFFVVSGFVVTHGLLAERARTGSIAPLRFYRRRFARLVPPLYAFVGAALIVCAVRGAVVPRADVIKALTFTTGHYSYSGTDLFAHTWSLSLEAAFYLAVAPLLARGGRRGVIAVLLVIFIAGPFVRAGNGIAAAHFLATGSDFSGWPRHVVLLDGADVIAIGALGAWGYARGFGRPGSPEHRWLGSVWLRVACALTLLMGPVLDATQNMTMIAQAFWSWLHAGAAVLLILSLLSAPAGAAHRFLNTRALRLCGLASYSIYLWQQLFLFPLPGFAGLAGWQRPALSPALALGCGLLSYLVIERRAHVRV